MDHESVPGVEPAEPIEPAHHRGLRVAPAAERVIAREDVVDVLGEAGDDRVPVPLAEPLEDGDCLPSDDRVVDAASLTRLAQDDGRFDLTLGDRPAGPKGGLSRQPTITA